MPLQIAFAIKPTTPRMTTAKSTKGLGVSTEAFSKQIAGAGFEPTTSGL